MKTSIAVLVATQKKEEQEKLDHAEDMLYVFIVDEEKIEPPRNG